MMMHESRNLSSIRKVGDNPRYKSNRQINGTRGSYENLINEENPKGSLFAVNGLFAKL